MTGADWEWHFIGKEWVGSYRVQAKRVSKKGSVTGIFRQAELATDNQVELLIKNAHASNFIPIHCFYCCEEHRSVWRAAAGTSSTPFLHGCLVAPAELVKSKAPKKLAAIEKDTVPWHYLLAPFDAHRNKLLLEERYQKNVPDAKFLEQVLVEYASGNYPQDVKSILLPDLNSKKGADLPRGLRSTKEYDRQRKELLGSALERRVSRVVEINVSGWDILERMARRDQQA